MGGSGTGIIGSEFPLLNALIAVMNAVFGQAHWYGRLIVLVTTSIGMLYFNRLIELLFSTRVAFASTLILLTSVWFEFGRKIMPDTFSVSLMVIALYQAYLFLRFGGNRALLLFAFLCCASGLSKMPALCLAGPLGILVFDRRLDRDRRWLVAVSSVPTIVAVVLWYFVWVPHLVETYHYQLYFPRSLLAGIQELWDRRAMTAEMFYFQAFRSFMGFAAFAVGLWFLIRRGARRVIIGFGLIAVTFGYFMIKAGEVFSTHGYYVIPFVPVMAVLAALTLERLPMKWSMLALTFICVEGVANQYYDLLVPERRRYLLGLEAIADRYATSGELVVVNGELDPEYMYFLHRKGWSVTNANCRDTEFLKGLASKGATTLFRFNTKDERTPDFPVLYQDPHVQIFALK